MTGHEIRNTFLKYFERNGHKIVKSSPLLPANDPTLLFANAGMNQFKDVFIGAETRDYKRATTSQKCVRAGGKHNDLDEVGKTARHHTFFEMLGNFSFGDYFKEDAIRFAWELLTVEFKLDPARLWFSVFEGDAEVAADDEAVELWVKAGAPRERVLKFGRKDNFWQMGETGPCGPCSEIHYYMGDNPNGPDNKAEYVNGDGDDTVEIWNLVFMQYNRSEIAPGQYKLDPLPAPSVDTGAGLERIAAVMQGHKTNYHSDLIKPIVDFAAQLSGKTYSYESQEGFAMRVVADHARATAFSIADGILPGNEGRNYVLRKIMRRAIYNGREHLGLKDAFFYKVCEFVIDFMKDAYPELDAQRDYILKMVRLEEQRFGTTMTVGLKKLDELIEKSGGEVPLFEQAKLYDTYGMPVDLMFVVLSQHGQKSIEALGEEQYRAEIEAQLKQLQQSGGEKHAAEEKKAKAAYLEVQRRENTKTEFKGYETTTVNGAKVVALIKGDDTVNSLQAGDEGEVVLDQTPFYAESGGQVGDVGQLTNDTATATVTNTLTPVQDVRIHKVKVEKGSLSVGDTLTAQVEVEKRDATRRNHTATHLMHAALREVLGTHVKQAGSIVAPDYLRFDFSHYQPLNSAEIEEIENLVNFHVLRNEPVQTDVLAIEEAMRTGAMALFGEKYGEKVRVLTVNGVEGIFSKELCGGTHVRATGDIGSFKIIADEAIASGTRRIRAVTGKGAFERFRTTENLLSDAAGKLNAVPAKLPAEIERLQSQLKDQAREIEKLKLKLAQGGGGAEDQITEINGLKVLIRKVEDLGKDGRRQLADSLLRKVAPGVVVIGDVVEGKASLLVMVSDDATKQVQAGKIIKALPGARGGGKADLAEGGVELDQLDAALQAVSKAIEGMV